MLQSKVPSTYEGANAERGNISRRKITPDYGFQTGDHMFVLGQAERKKRGMKKNIVYNIIDNACLEELFLIGGNNSLLVKIYYMVLFFHYLPLSERSLWFIYWKTGICMGTSAGMNIHSIRPAWQTVTETKSACRCGNTHGWLLLLFFHYVPYSTQPSPNIDLIFT